MPIAVIIDQKRSRGAADEISGWLPRVNNDWRDDLRRQFIRTAGDEMQALLEDPAPAIDLMLQGLRLDSWWLGIGLGEVEQPLGATAAESRGSAFYNAREASIAAKKSPYSFAVIGDDRETTQAVTAALTLLAGIASRRGPKQWEAVELRNRGRSQKEIAARLEISQQAVSQRLQAAGWQEECEGRWLASWLLEPLAEIDA